jgi:flagellum-specific ATP synthase
VSPQAASPLVRIGGTISQVTPSALAIEGLSRVARLGDCIHFDSGDEQQMGEVVRITGDDVTVKPYASCANVRLGAAAWHAGRFSIAPHEAWKGRVVNALGEPLDGRGALVRGRAFDPRGVAAPGALERALVRQPIVTGVRAIDIFTPLCAGQRVGVFAGSGVGKSTLLAMLTQACAHDAVVIALVGERGREVRDFLHDVLEPELDNITAVIATGDESAMLRKLAPETAMGIAEFFRAEGKSVLLIVDSLTRYAHAARDVALAAGEPPVARGFAPSVFTDLPRLIERGGPGRDGEGTITGVFSVLVDGDDPNEPVADCLRGTLDGHILLSRAVADEGRFPAVDVLASVSRLAGRVWSQEQLRAVQELRGLVARFEDSRDLRLMGGYQAGTDVQLDHALKVVPRLYDFLNQRSADAGGSDPFAELARALGPEPVTAAVSS